MKHADGLLQSPELSGEFLRVEVVFRVELLPEDILEQADCKWIVASP
jgi:hypothetical protein